MEEKKYISERELYSALFPIWAVFTFIMSQLEIEGSMWGVAILFVISVMLTIFSGYKALRPKQKRNDS